MRRLASLLLTLALALAGCDAAPDKPAGRQRHTPPPQRVETITVQPHPLHIERELNASIVARRIARVYSEETGRIVQMQGYPGDPVSAGGLLARLDDSLLRTDLAKARATTRQARLDVQRLRKLQKRGVASHDELNQAETALNIAIADQKRLETRLARTRIEAPFDGILSQRLHEPGDVIAANTQLFALFDPASQYARIQVADRLLSHVHPGDTAAIRIDALPGQRYSGQITRIHPTLDPLTRRGAVEIDFDAPPPGLKPGQFARVRLRIRLGEHLSIPFTALQRDREGVFVYIVEQGRAQRRAVRGGARSGREIVIDEGLQAGDQVIVRGFLGLRAGKPVEALPAAGNAA